MTGRTRALRPRAAALGAIAAILLVPRARGADDVSRRLAESARAADGIESSMDALDRSSDERRARDSARCRDGFTMDGLMRHFDQRGLTADLGLNMAMVENHSLCYYQCLAYSHKDLSFCEPMKAFKINVGLRGGHLPGNLACMDHNYDLHYVRALITRSPDFKTACRDNLLQGLVHTVELTSATADAYCDTVLAKADDPAALCKAIDPNSFRAVAPGANVAKCESFYRGIHGEAEACERLPDESHIKERCFGYAAFYKAFHANDPKLCGGNPICRIFFGDGPEACRPYSVHVGGAVCREAPDYDDPAARDKALADEARENQERENVALGPVRELKGDIDALGPLLPGASDAERAQAAALSRRYEALLQRTGRSASSAPSN